MRSRPTAELVCTLSLLLGGCGDSSRPDDSIAPAFSTRTDAVIPNRYIITLNPGSFTVAAEANRMVAAQGGRLLFIYQHAIRGFAAELSPGAVQALGKDPAVQRIEPDRKVTIHGVQSPAGQWGLDRIDQRVLPLDGLYQFDNRAPAVHIYLIDTGILRTHSEFRAGTISRATAGFNAINDGNGKTDCNGHGTHMAGVAGGKTYGVAKSAKLVSVRVLNCQGAGSTANVIAGVDWVTANSIKPAVALMALGSTLNTPLTQAVNNSIASGVVYAVSAGASNSDACQFSPGNAPNALTVAASDMTDKRASFSNIGPCIDLFAPGVSIKSAWRTSSTATAILSGTSISASLVAGAAAIYLQVHPAASPVTANNAIINLATTGVLSGIGVGSPNRLLFTVGLGQ
jgi:subtilisin family serine protease